MARDGLGWQWYVHCPDLKLRTWRYLGPFAAKWQCFGIKRWVWFFFLVSTSLPHQGHVLQPQQVPCVLYRRRKIAQATGETRGLHRIRIQTNGDFAKLPWKNPSDRARSKPHWKIRSSRAWRRKIGASGKTNGKKSSVAQCKSFQTDKEKDILIIQVCVDLMHDFQGFDAFQCPYLGCCWHCRGPVPREVAEEATGCRRGRMLYHRAGLLRYRFQLNEAVHLCNLFFLQDYQFGGFFVFCFLGPNLHFFTSCKIIRTCYNLIKFVNKIWFEEHNFKISGQPEPIAEVISAVALVALKGRDRAAYRRVTDGSLRRLFFLLKLETWHVGRLDIWDVFWKGASRGFITLWPINYWALTCHTDFFLPFLSL